MIKFKGSIKDLNGGLLIKKVEGYYKIFENMSNSEEWSGTFEILKNGKKLTPGEAIICTKDGKEGKIGILNLHTKSDGIKWASFMGCGPVPQ
jgi:hypothetical protein